MKKIYLLFSLLIPCNSYCEGNEYYFSVKGGVSLGSYESGVNWVMLKNLKEKEKDEGGRVVSFSGASAGSINALISAIDYCLDSNQSIDPDNNIFRNTWDIGLQDLLNKKNGSDNAIFSRGVFEDKLSKINSILENSKSENGCDFVITMSVTSFNPLEYKVEGKNEYVKLQRFVVPLHAFAGKGERVKFFNYYPMLPNEPDGKLRGGLPSEYIFLPEKRCDNGEANDCTNNEISFEYVKSLAYASSAFPMAFEPVKISVCILTDMLEQKCEHKDARAVKFSDGGMFDNSPIGVGLDVDETKEPFYGDKKVHVFINPDHYRINRTERNGYVLFDDDVGMAEYIGHVFNSFNTATQHEYIEAIYRHERGSTKKRFHITSRYHDLVADFHQHFGAFYTKEFRRHDYYVGVYDGMYSLSYLECDGKDDCDIRDKIAENIQWLESVSSISDESLDFIKYLYNSEFDKSYVLDGDVRENILIALAESFLSKSKSYGSDESFGLYVEKLKYNLESKFNNINLSETHGTDKVNELYSIVDNYGDWKTEKINNVYSNLIEMQESTSENNSKNEIIGKLLKVGRPVVQSVITHSETERWPLAASDWLGMSGAFSLRHGFDFGEKAHVTSLAMRPKFLGYGQWSLDVGVDYHRFGSELDNEEYFSYLVGPTYHFDSIIFSTAGIYYEHADEGIVYDGGLSGVQVYFGLINEIIAFKINIRSNFDSPISGKYREEHSAILQVDVTKLLKISFGL